MVEYEKKILLTEAEYKALLSMIPSESQQIIQVNHYFDTVDLENHAQGITFRIREKNGRFTATEKRHQIGSPERNLEYSRPAKSAHDAGVFGVKNLLYQGTLTTERVTWEADKYTCICLDKNTYLGITDYELEIEYSSVLAFENKWLRCAIKSISMAALLQQPDSCPSIHAGQEKSKSARFFDRKQQHERRDTYAIHS